MVGITSVLAPRLSRLIIDADLDMKGYGILNAVLKDGNKLGANLDAQGMVLINAVLGSGTKLGADLDAQGKAIANAVLGYGVKLGADLDAQGKTIINAVLGSGTKLGADLDAQGKTVINATLSGAKLAGSLDAAGNKIINLVHDDANPTSGATMGALLDAIYPSIFYDKYLCWSSEQVPPLLYSGYTTGPRRILNIRPDYGNLARTYAVETAYTIVYYYDMRHSHDLDTQDVTRFDTNSTTGVEVLKYDYGSVLSVKELYIIAGLWVGGYTGTLKAEISSDGATWTTAWQVSTTATSEVIYRTIIRNVSFRFLRFVIINSGSNITYATVRKIVITV